MRVRSLAARRALPPVESRTERPMTGEEFTAGLPRDLARWRDELAKIPEGSGFDTQRTMISAWIKEGQCLLDRLD